jgi:hypothetical protein
VLLDLRRRDQRDAVRLAIAIHAAALAISIGLDHELREILDEQLREGRILERRAALLECAGGRRRQLAGIRALRRPRQVQHVQPHRHRQRADHQPEADRRDRQATGPRPRKRGVRGRDAIAARDVVGHRLRHVERGDPLHVARGLRIHRAAELVGGERRVDQRAFEPLPRRAPEHPVDLAERRTRGIVIAGFDPGGEGCENVAADHGG